MDKGVSLYFRDNECHFTTSVVFVEMEKPGIHRIEPDKVLTLIMKQLQSGTLRDEFLAVSIYSANLEHNPTTVCPFYFSSLLGFVITQPIYSAANANCPFTGETTETQPEQPLEKFLVQVARYL